MSLDPLTRSVAGGEALVVRVCVELMMMDVCLGRPNANEARRRLRAKQLILGGIIYVNQSCGPFRLEQRDKCTCKSGPVLVDAGRDSGLTDMVRGWDLLAATPTAEDRSDGQESCDV